MARKSCYNCARKHISKAIVQLAESKLGYPSHKWLAIGNLSEAEDEIEKIDHDLAIKIRGERLMVEKEGDSDNLLSLIEEICGKVKGDPCPSGTCSD